MFGGPALKGRPLPGSQGVAPPRETRRADLARVHRQREGGPAREFGQAPLPVLPRPFAPGRPGRGGVGEILGEGVPRFGGVLGVRVDRGQIGEQHSDAVHVGDQQVGVDVDALRPAGTQAQPDVEHLARGDVEHPVGQAFPQRPQGVFGGLGRELREVVDPQAGPGDAVGDPLCAVVRERGAQHGVQADQGDNGLLEAPGHHVLGVDLQVGVAPDAAEGPVGAAADPVRLLHGGQRERRTPVDGSDRAGGGLRLRPLRRPARGEQSVPGREPRVLRHLGEVDARAGPVHPVDQGHQLQ